MPLSTQHYTEAIKQQYCEYFGVDDFECKDDLDNYIVKDEILFSCFGLFRTMREIRFYNYITRWKIDKKEFKVMLPPIIEKYKNGRNTLYQLDEEKMKEQLLNVIQSSYERYENEGN